MKYETRLAIERKKLAVSERWCQFLQWLGVRERQEPFR